MALTLFLLRCQELNPEPLYKRQSAFALSYFPDPEAQ